MYELYKLFCCRRHLLLLKAFAKGVGPFLEAVMEHDFIHATKLTLMLAAITVPLNTLFGTVAAILITRNEFPGKVRAGSSISASGQQQQWQ
jgi:sulfate transport system permease protein